MSTMPPKKRDKEGESSKNQRSDSAKPVQDPQFCQAFEKPTQIYQLLKVRNADSPIFLHRNLSYMRYRMSRSHKSRQSFKIDSLLEKVSKKLIPPSLRGGFMTITFLGFYDKKSATVDVPNEPVKVETLLRKLCHKKRKDAKAQTMHTVTVGTSIVPMNPSEECPPPKAPTVSISVDEFCDDQSEVKSYHLLLRVYNAPVNGVNGTGGSEQETGEPIPKRRRTSTSRDEIKLFGTDLVVYDKQKQCLLGDGDYELLMDEHPRNSRRQSWEHVGDISKLLPMCLQRIPFSSQDCNSFERFSSGPTLKFKLEWSREQRSSFVDRPRSVPARDEETLDTNGNKENKQDRASKKPAADKKEEEKKLREKPTIVYQLHYNNNSRQQTAPCFDLCCPWCRLDCGNLFSLLKHLKLCHARFTFTYTPIDNVAQIDVAINESYDGSYTGSPHDIIAQPGGSAFSRNGPQIRTCVSNILVCHPKRQNASLAEFMELEDESGDLQRSFITGHNRLYHHTVTCLPVNPKEMENDSEDENDPKWLQAKTIMMIDEFTDVNEGEKELMKMWNLHVMKEGYVGDCQVPLACSKFLEKKGKELLDKNLYRNFVVHMCSLFDYGLISPVAFYQTIQQLHEMVNDVHAKLMQSSWEAQKEHWIKSGAKEKQNTPSHFKAQAPTGISADPSIRRKLYSPGSFKSESPSRHKAPQQVEDEEENDEDDDDEEDEEEDTDKGGIQKSSCSSSASSTSSESVATKKKSLVCGSDLDKKKSNIVKVGSVCTSNNATPKGQLIQNKPHSQGQKLPSNSCSKPHVSENSNGDTLKRKAPSSIPNQSIVKTTNSASNEPPAKKKIIAQPNGKPQAVSSQNASVCSDLKRKLSSAGVTSASSDDNSDCFDSKKSVNGVGQQNTNNKIPPTQGVNDAKKRLPLPIIPWNGTNSLNSITCATSQSVDLKKKHVPNGVTSLDGKLVSNCTVEMVPILEDIASLSSSKLSTPICNDAKRKSSLGQNPIGSSLNQGDSGLQRRKSICADSAPVPVSESSLVLPRRKSFSSNQSSEPSTVQTLASKGIVS
ncbi:hypothetical protein ONE63_006416 [Megalurothrips usitatus]|uniref:Polycomb protein suz12-A n=1 Tax=Megalurothrips usitatus TaxID=439358 RepID=A0AAV7XTB7_9NEOP|nr:hypothetical protein ONE63_006416 [Megalurothrips usitatus]